MQRVKMCKFVFMKPIHPTSYSMRYEEYCAKSNTPCSHCKDKLSLSERRKRNEEKWKCTTQKNAEKEKQDEKRNPERIRLRKRSN